MINVNLLRRTLDHLHTDARRFAMLGYAARGEYAVKVVYADDSRFGVPDCETVCCLAGTVLLVQDKLKFSRTGIPSNTFGGIEDIAGKDLGLTDNQRSLFHVDRWPGPARRIYYGAKTAEARVTALERAMKHFKVEVPN